MAWGLCDLIFYIFTVHFIYVALTHLWHWLGGTGLSNVHPSDHISYLPNTSIPSQVILRLGIIWWIIILMPSSTLSHRWRSLCSALFLALWLSLSCIEWLGADEIFLRGPKSTLWLETFFQCPAHSNGRRLRSGDKNTVRDRSKLWSSAPSNASRRLRYYSCQCFGNIDYYLKLVQSRHRPSRPTIQYLLQQASRFEYPFPRRIHGNSSLLQLDHTLPCSTNCKFFVSYFEGNLEPIWSYDHRSGWGFVFGSLPYGDVWRASRRMFTKHFNPSDPSINQPQEIRYVRRFLGQLLQKPSDFLQHVRTYVPIYYISSHL